MSTFDFNDFSFTESMQIINNESLLLPGVAAHSMIIEIWGGSSRAALDCRCAAAGQTTSRNESSVNE